jgi:hypothetical protein
MSTSPPPPRRYLHAARAWLLALTVVGALAACSSGGSSTPSSDSVAPGVAPANNAGKAADAAAAPEGAVPLQKGDPQQGGSGTGSGTNQQAPAQIEPQQRSLIYNGAMSVKVDDVAVAANRAIDVANGMGGAVGGDKRTLDADRSEAQLVLRVPSEKFSAALTELGKLGTEQTRSVDTQDVTEALVDLDSRLATQRASVERVRALMAKAQTVGEVFSVESEVARREADLDSLEQRKAKLAGLVALSTITLELRGPAAPTPSGEEPDPGFLAGLRNGWSAFVDSIEVVLVAAGWLLPWVVILGIPVWVLIRLRRRRTTPAPAPDSAPPVPEPSL